MKKITLLLLSLLTMSTLFAQKPVSIQPLRAPQATQEVVNLVASDWNYSDDYNDKGVTIFYLYTTDYTFIFAIKQPIASIISNLGKVYTLADMDEEYTGILVGEEPFNVTAASIKVTINLATQSAIVEASMTSGDYTFNITYGVTPSEPINVTASGYNCADVYSDYGFTQYTLSTSDFTCYFAIKLPLASIEENKTYTLEDMDENYSWVRLGEDASASYSSATYKQYTDAEGRLHAEATVTFSYSSTTYTIHISYIRDAAPAEYTMVDLTMENVRFWEGQGFCEFGGMTADGTCQAKLDYNTTTGVAGEFGENDCEVQYNIFKKNDDQLQLVKVTANVVAIENGYKAEAWFYAYDGNCYHCTFVYTVPQPTTRVNLTVNNAQINDENFGGQQSSFVTIEASDNNYYMTLEVNTLAIAGTYTEANLNGTFSFFRDANNKMYSIYTANLTIEEIADGVYHITGTALCYGDIEFTLDLTTAASTGIEDIKADATSLRKIYENGVLYMVRPDGTIYNAAGTRIR